VMPIDAAAARRHDAGLAPRNTSESPAIPTTPRGRPSLTASTGQY
jgi:hypothetical protein